MSIYFVTSYHRNNFLRKGGRRGYLRPETLATTASPGTTAWSEPSGDRADQARCAWCSHDTWEYRWWSAFLHLPPLPAPSGDSPPVAWRGTSHRRTHQRGSWALRTSEPRESGRRRTPSHPWPVPSNPGPWSSPSIQTGRESHRWNALRTRGVDVPLITSLVPGLDFSIYQNTISPSENRPRAVVVSFDNSFAFRFLVLPW